MTPGTGHCTIPLFTVKGACACPAGVVPASGWCLRTLLRGRAGIPEAGTISGENHKDRVNLRRVVNVMIRSDDVSKRLGLECRAALSEAKPSISAHSAWSVILCEEPLEPLALSMKHTVTATLCIEAMTA